jgi:hypothetical protein
MPNRKLQPRLTIKNTSPLQVSRFLRWVLVPEIAVSLIMDDLVCDMETATEVLVDSREYGYAVHDVEGDNDAGFDSSGPQSGNRPSRYVPLDWLSSNHLTFTGELVHLRCGMSDYLSHRVDHIPRKTGYPPTVVFDHNVLNTPDLKGATSGRGKHRKVNETAITTGYDPQKDPEHLYWLKSVRSLPSATLSFCHSDSLTIYQCGPVQRQLRAY